MILSRREYKEGARLFSPYPVLLQMLDGEALCAECTRSQARRILEELHTVELSARYPGACGAISSLCADSSWVPVAFFTHEEGSPIECAHCYAQIESAYGDPDAEEQD